METKIDYLDKVVNLICGCTAGCPYCWARNRYAPRFAHNCAKCGTFTPHFHEERLKLINRIKKPSIIGLNFMGDTWDPAVKPEWRQEIFRKIFNFQSQSKYIILTKQPQNIKSSDIINESIYGYINPENLWVGVSIESIDHIDRWVALSQKEYIRHKIISFEPVMEDFKFSTLKLCFSKYGYPDWIVIGALTKFNKELEYESRLRSLDLLNIIRRIDKDIPVFVKDNVGSQGAPKEFPESIRPTMGE